MTLNISLCKPLQLNIKLCRSLNKSIDSKVKTTNLVQQFSIFKPDENTKILDTVNNKNEGELLCYNISKACAVNLKTWKVQYGPLKQLRDILYIKGFGVKLATKFYKSILEKNLSHQGLIKSNKIRLRKFLLTTPGLVDEHREHIQFCVSLHVNYSSIAWARLELQSLQNSACLLTHWQHHNITERKLHLNDLVQRLHYVVNQIPTADCYIFENRQTELGVNSSTVNQLYINTQKAQISAILSYALSTRIEREKLWNTQAKQSALNTPKTFYLRKFLTARLFNNFLGNERVSVEATVLSLMHDYKNFNQNDCIVDSKLSNERLKIIVNQNHHSAFRSYVEFPASLSKMFLSSNQYQREFLGQALLLNLTFVRLVLMQDPNSIQSVLRNCKKTGVA